MVKKWRQHGGGCVAPHVLKKKTVICDSPLSAMLAPGQVAENPTLKAKIWWQTWQTFGKSLIMFSAIFHDIGN